MTAAVVTIGEDDGVTDSFLSTWRVLDRLGYRVASLTYYERFIFVSEFRTICVKAEYFVFFINT